jgi:hypothetical protein
MMSNPDPNVAAQEGSAGGQEQGAPHGQGSPTNTAITKKRGEQGPIVKFMTSPGTVGTLTGAVVLGAAVLWGALEAAIGAGAAYVAYRVLRKRAGARAGAVLQFARKRG